MGGCGDWLEPEFVGVGEFDAAFDALLLREDVVRALGLADLVPPAAFFRAAVGLPDFVDFDAGGLFAFELLVDLVLLDPVADDTRFRVAVFVVPEGSVVGVVLVDLN